MHMVITTLLLASLLTANLYLHAETATSLVGAAVLGLPFLVKFGLKGTLLIMTNGTVMLFCLTFLPFCINAVSRKLRHLDV